jgi:hypothetical protein
MRAEAGRGVSSKLKRVGDIKMRAKSWSESALDALWSGSVASVVSTAVLSMCGCVEHRDPFMPLNGPSQWIWGRHAPYVPGFSVRHTVAGYVIHHTMSVLWAIVFEKMRSNHAATRVLLNPVGAAVATSAAACFVDYRVATKRFTPGFEKQLSKLSLLATYSAFALALAGAAIVARK